MNETLKTILSRRSIRSYKPDQIKNEELLEVIEAGKYAASCMGLQSAYFVAVQNPELRARLSELNSRVRGNPDDSYYGAPTFVLVFSVPTGRMKPEDAVKDGSCAMQNMMVAARAAGLGSCWINGLDMMMDTKDGRALMSEWGLPGNAVGIGVCILGYPECEHPEPAPRKEDFVYYVK